MKRNSKVYFLTISALIAAILCIFGPLTIPVGPVPVTLMNFFLYFFLVIFGWKLTTTAYLVYFILGAIGLPVFSGFQCGPGVIAGPTGGYLTGFFLICIIGGLLLEKVHENHPLLKKVFVLLGISVPFYILGLFWFVFVTGTEPAAAFWLTVVPFLPLDIVKIILAVVLGTKVKKMLKKYS